ncbi:CPBP family intramembrane glutamic endopeptidase [Halomonas maura]|uniref:CPBP family intramembrane glutamic endopeptidase n=1 Tax=Halomonas maura TaxID=117606 RepID=UPI0025B4FEA9|nr:CPBP family intramembrane glutamic endopeptidase [Halomonas maura]MDN3557433.1 CPBP family intramembrane metalloprotease [Halomonas maura]
MLPFGILYSLCLLLCGLSREARLRYGGAAVVLLAAAAVGYAGGSFVAPALGYVALTAWMAERRAPPWLARGRVLAWLVASAGLVTHAWPGVQGLLLAEATVLKAGSVPMSLYFHHDKVLVAWSLLAWLPLFDRSARPLAVGRSWAVAPLVAGGVLAIMGLAAVLGLVAWQPGLPALFWAFAIANLLNTCVAEELLFRGLLQRWLVERAGWRLGLFAASGLFGIAHLAGGTAFVLVATAAGGLYGLVYLWTGRLVWAVLVHWGLNLTHLALFTYPMTA